MKLMFLVDRGISQVFQNIKTLVVQNDVTSVYMEYVNEAFRWFFVIYCWRIGIYGENALVRPFKFGLG